MTGQGSSVQHLQPLQRQTECCGQPPVVMRMLLAGVSPPQGRQHQRPRATPPHHLVHQRKGLPTTLRPETGRWEEHECEKHRGLRGKRDIFISCYAEEHPEPEASSLLDNLTRTAGRPVYYSVATVPKTSKIEKCFAVQVTLTFAKTVMKLQMA